MGSQYHVTYRVTPAYALDTDVRPVALRIDIELKRPVAFFYFPVVSGSISIPNVYPSFATRTKIIVFLTNFAAYC